MALGNKREKLAGKERYDLFVKYLPMFEDISADPDYTTPLSFPDYEWDKVVMSVLREKKPFSDIQTTRGKVIAVLEELFELVAKQPPPHDEDTVLQVFMGMFDFDQVDYPNQLAFNWFIGSTVNRMMRILQDDTEPVPADQASLLEAVDIVANNIEGQDLEAHKAGDDKAIDNGVKLLDFIAKNPDGPELWFRLTQDQIDGLDLLDAESAELKTFLEHYIYKRTIFDDAINAFENMPGKLTANQSATFRQLILMRDTLRDRVREAIVPRLEAIFNNAGLPLDAEDVLDDYEEFDGAIYAIIIPPDKGFIQAIPPQIVELLVVEFPGPNEGMDRFVTNIGLEINTTQSVYDDLINGVKRIEKIEDLELDTKELLVRPTFDQTAFDKNTDQLKLELEDKDELEDQLEDWRKALEFMQILLTRGWAQARAKERLELVIKKLESYIETAQVQLENLTALSSWIEGDGPEMAERLAAEQGKKFELAYPELLRYSEGVDSMAIFAQKQRLSELLIPHLIDDRFVGVALLLEISSQVVEAGKVNFAKLEELVRKNIFKGKASQAEIKGVIVVVLQSASKGKGGVTPYQKQLLEMAQLAEAEEDDILEHDLLNIFVQPTSKRFNRSLIKNFLNNRYIRNENANTEASVLIQAIEEYDELESSVMSYQTDYPLWLGIKDQQIDLSKPEDMRLLLDSYTNRLNIIGKIKEQPEIYPIGDIDLEQWEIEVKNAFYNYVQVLIITQLPSGKEKLAFAKVMGESDQTEKMRQRTETQINFDDAYSLFADLLPKIPKELKQGLVEHIPFFRNALLLVLHRSSEDIGVFYDKYKDAHYQAYNILSERMKNLERFAGTGIISTSELAKVVRGLVLLRDEVIRQVNPIHKYNGTIRSVGSIAVQLNDWAEGDTDAEQLLNQLDGSLQKLRSSQYRLTGALNRVQEGIDQAEKARADKLEDFPAILGALYGLSSNSRDSSIFLRLGDLRKAIHIQGREFLNVKEAAVAILFIVKRDPKLGYTEDVLAAKILSLFEENINFGLNINTRAGRQEQKRRVRAVASQLWEAINLDNDPIAYGLAEALTKGKIMASDDALKFAADIDAITDISSIDIDTTIPIPPPAPVTPPVATAPIPTAPVAPTIPVPSVPAPVVPAPVVNPTPVSPPVTPMPPVTPPAPPIIDSEPDEEPEDLPRSTPISTPTVNVEPELTQTAQNLAPEVPLTAKENNAEDKRLLTESLTASGIEVSVVDGLLPTSTIDNRFGSINANLAKDAVVPVGKVNLPVQNINLDESGVVRMFLRKEAFNLSEVPLITVNPSDERGINTVAEGSTQKLMGVKNIIFPSEPKSLSTIKLYLENSERIAQNTSSIRSIELRPDSVAMELSYGMSMDMESEWGGMYNVISIKNGEVFLLSSDPGQPAKQIYSEVDDDMEVTSLPALEEAASGEASVTTVENNGNRKPNRSDLGDWEEVLRRGNIAGELLDDLIDGGIIRDDGSIELVQPVGHDYRFIVGGHRVEFARLILLPDRKIEIIDDEGNRSIYPDNFPLRWSRQTSVEPKVDDAGKKRELITRLVEVVTIPDALREEINSAVESDSEAVALNGSEIVVDLTSMSSREISYNSYPINGARSLIVGDRRITIEREPLSLNLNDITISGARNVEIKDAEKLISIQSLPKLINLAIPPITNLSFGVIYLETQSGRMEAIQQLGDVHTFKRENIEPSLFDNLDPEFQRLLVNGIQYESFDTDMSSIPLAYEVYIKATNYKGKEYERMVIKGGELYLAPAIEDEFMPVILTPSNVDIPPETATVNVEYDPDIPAKLDTEQTEIRHPAAENIGSQVEEANRPVEIEDIEDWEEDLRNIGISGGLLSQLMENSWLDGTGVIQLGERTKQSGFSVTLEGEQLVPFRNIMLRKPNIIDIDVNSAEQGGNSVNFGKIKLPYVSNIRLEGGKWKIVQVGNSAPENTEIKLSSEPNIRLLPFENCDFSSDDGGESMSAERLSVVLPGKPESLLAIRNYVRQDRRHLTNTRIYKDGRAVVQMSEPMKAAFEDTWGGIYDAIEIQEGSVTVINGEKRKQIYPTIEVEAVGEQEVNPVTSVQESEQVVNIPVRQAEATNLPVDELERILGTYPAVGSPEWQRIAAALEAGIGNSDELTSGIRPEMLYRMAEIVVAGSYETNQGKTSRRAMSPREDRYREIAESFMAKYKTAPSGFSESSRVVSAAEVLNKIPEIYPPRGFEQPLKFKSYTQYTGLLAKRNLVPLDMNWVLNNITMTTFRSLDTTIGTGYWMAIAAAFVELRRIDANDSRAQILAAIITQATTASTIIPGSYPQGEPSELAGLWSLAETYLKNIYTNIGMGGMSNFESMFGQTFNQPLGRQVERIEIHEIGSQAWFRQARLFRQQLGITPRNDALLRRYAYALLGLESGTTKDKVKSKYFSLARIYMPDVTKLEKDVAEAIFKDLNEANNFLQKTL